MGQEILCTVHFAGRPVQGRALLESAEILFRGDSRLKIPFSSIKEVKAINGELRVITANGSAVFELGAHAEKWRDKILNPKSLLEKLGVKPGQCVTLHGAFDKHFLVSLKKHGSKVSATADSAWIFFAAETAGELSKVKSIARRLQGDVALWIVYPKGQTSITEGDVRGAGRKTGLTDVKVASFSPTHTALKFVIPKAKR